MLYVYFNIIIIDYSCVELFLLLFDGSVNTIQSNTIRNEFVPLRCLVGTFDPVQVYVFQTDLQFICFERNGTKKTIFHRFKMSRLSQGKNKKNSNLYHGVLITRQTNSLTCVIEVCTFLNSKFTHFYRENERNP